MLLSKQNYESVSNDEITQNIVNLNRIDKSNISLQERNRINNYTKGYSPLMCSPHRYEYIKQRKNSSSQMRKNSDEDN